eukprot:3214274-Alexandrium_andersonii.AAC.2
MADSDGGVDDRHARKCAKLPRCLPGLHLGSVGRSWARCFADCALPVLRNQHKLRQECEDALPTTMWANKWEHHTN